MRLSQAPRRFVGKVGLCLAATALVAVAPALRAGPPPEPVGGGTGTIKGRLVWAGAEIPKAKVEVVKGDPKVKDAVCKVNQIVSKEITVDPATKGIADAIVYLVKPVGDFGAAQKALLAKTPSVVIDQVNCEFVPYVAVVQKDQKLTFKSSDPVGHNVHLSPFNNPQINTMLPPNGSLPYAIKQEERRPTKLVCDIHPWMSGYIFILEHPLATVTKADGSFEISGVPPGEQHLVVWQSRNGIVSEGGNKGVAITVPADGTVEVPVIKMTTLK